MSRHYLVTWLSSKVVRHGIRGSLFAFGLAFIVLLFWAQVGFGSEQPSSFTGAVYLPLLRLPGEPPTPTNIATATAVTTGTPVSTIDPTTTATATPTHTVTQTSTATATATPSVTVTPQTNAEYAITWTFMENYPRFRNGKNMGNSEGQAIVFNNKLYVFGGYEQSSFLPLCDVYVYDPAAGTKGEWTQLNNMPNGRGVTHAAIAADTNYIYIVGGYLEGGSNDSNCGSNGQTYGTRIGWQYDPALDTYTRLPDLPATRAAGSAVVVGRNLHYFGGTIRQGGGMPGDEVGDHYVLNLDNLAGGWTALAPLPNPRHHAAAVAYNGNIYVIGGQRGHDGNIIPETFVHLYNPTTDTWLQLASLPEARNHMGNATFVLDGKIFIIGGQVGNNVSRATVSIYDIARNEWSEALTPMPSARHSVVGGTINGDIYYSTGEFSTATWKGTLQLVVP